MPSNSQHACLNVWNLMFVFEARLFLTKQHCHDVSSLAFLCKLLEALGHLVGRGQAYTLVGSLQPRAFSELSCPFGPDVLATFEF
jgi:hypothetical protein